MKTATCSSCQAEIIWTITEASGARMPVDAKPLDVLDAPSRGVFVLVKRLDEAPLACSAGLDDERLKTYRLREVALYTSHFAHCPNARAHRKTPETASAA